MGPHLEREQGCAHRGASDGRASPVALWENRMRTDNLEMTLDALVLECVDAVVGVLEQKGVTVTDEERDKLGELLSSKMVFGVRFTMV